ncbi:MAG TPA: hypothetical protein VGM02_16165 [Acidobacteriaceae bacterium]|jgi:hypothetical protein
MRRRTRTTLLVAAIVIVLLGILAWLRQKAPPEVARLLPESDGIVFINFEPLRAAMHFDQHPVQHDASYQKFINATGFVFERDLRQAAIAMHHMQNPRGPNGPVAYSEVFAGRFDHKRLTAWLEANSSSREQYADRTIYSLESQNRTVRVVMLGYEMVAVSNTPTAEQIHAIVDRYRTAALPFSGSSVLSDYYSQVPTLSIAWGIGRISLPFWSEGGPRVFGVRLPLDANTAFIASVRFLGNLRLRVEEIAPSQGDATAATSALQNMIGLLSAAMTAVQNNPQSKDYRTLINSATVTQHGSRTVLTATVPLDLVKQLAGSNP